MQCVYFRCRNLYKNIFNVHHCFSSGVSTIFCFWRAIYTEMACIIFKKQVDRKEKRKLVSFSKKLAVREEMSN